MTTYGPGSVVRRRRLRLGPVPWSLVTGVWKRLGFTWWLVEEEDTDPGGGASTFAFAFAGGWLTVHDGPGTRGGFGEARADGLARHLAAAGGRAVVLREEEVELRPRAGALGTTARITDTTVAPDGGRRVVEHDGVDDDYDLDADWVADESADALADEVWDAVALPTPIELPPRHPELAPRRGHLRAPGSLPPVVEGPSVTLGGAGWRRSLDAAGRVQLEAALARAGALDSEGQAPDLDRWRLRAARRAGLDAVPAVGDPAHAAWAAVFAELTRGDRATPGRDGRVAAWKLRTPGSWLLDPAEIAHLASAPGVPEALRARGDVPDWTVDVADDAAPAAPPWTL